MAIDAGQLSESRPVVLAIDDSADVHRLLRARLKNEDLELVATSDSGEGIRLVGELKPALVLLDLDMPGMDGFQILRRIKEDRELLHIPVIVLSGLQTPQDKVTAFDLGAMDYITKPFDVAELRVRVRSALKLHSLLQMLAQRAQIDGLTGLWNRLYFESRWAEEVARATRYSRPLSLALCDLDHFKSINDTYGHPAGDAVLQGFARILQREGRQTDIACRYGGEEFALILPDTSPPDAYRLCDRIRQTLQNVAWPRHADRNVTVSMGLVGCANAGALPAPAWVERADQNMYAAKNAGRNRITSTNLSATNLRLAAG